MESLAKGCGGFGHCRCQLLYTGHFTVHTVMSLMANMQGATWLRVTLAACSLWANYCYFLVLPPPDHGALFFLVNAAKSVAQVRFSLLTRASRLRLLTASEGENVLSICSCVLFDVSGRLQWNTTDPTHQSVLKFGYIMVAVAPRQSTF